MDSPWIYVGGWVAITALLTVLLRSLERRRHPLGATVRATRNVLLPLALVLVLGVQVFAWEANTSAARKWVESLLWLAGIGVGLSLVKNTALVRQEAGQYRTRIPKLLVDILRLLLVLVGACFVISGVWDYEIGGLLTAVGISSIVLGLALQNTLDNVMAGIAVLVERPFEVGDWIKVGDITGVVSEMNWRSLRVRTRARDMVVVPNSVIGKETLINYSRPTRLHGEVHQLGFSYDDPPNKVKRILQQVALTTRGVVADPAPIVRTIGYGAYAIDYQVRFFLDDYERVQEINDEFMTKVWYAARRNGLSIPFPTQVSFEHRMQQAPPPPAGPGNRDLLLRVPVFVPLGPEDLESLHRDAVRLDFGRGERVVHQGDPGEAMFVILEGAAVVSLRDEQGTEREVARLHRGEFFGEMSLLTGEPRNANVTAVDDLSVLQIHKESLQGILARRPALAQEMAEIAAARRQGLRAIAESESGAPVQRERLASATGELVQRIRRFFGL